jgi:carbon-monoxide dehydrogenase large subunit
MINPMVVEGQIAGGVVQGIGGVLFEDMAYDDAGNPLATTFLDYSSRPLRPDFEYGHVESMSNSLGGYKGMGEGGARLHHPGGGERDQRRPGTTRRRSAHGVPFGPSQVLAALNAA